MDGNAWNTEFNNEYWDEVITPLSKYFEPCQPDKHDVKRVSNFIAKFEFEPVVDQIYHANRVCNLIKNPEKAYRRGKAYAMTGIHPQVCKAYFDRAVNLIVGEIDKAMQ